MNQSAWERYKQARLQQVNNPHPSDSSTSTETSNTEPISPETSSASGEGQERQHNKGTKIEYVHLRSEEC